MLLDQIEYVASKGTVSAEEFYIEYGTYIDIVPLNKAKEFYCQVGKVHGRTPTKPNPSQQEDRKAQTNNPRLIQV